MTTSHWLDLAALVPLGLSGGSAAVRKGMDMYGAMVLAVVTGLGGGLAADLLVGLTPRVFQDDRLLLLSAGCGIVAFMAGLPMLTRWHRTIHYLDAFGLGLYAVAGAQRGINAGVSLTGVVFLGVVAGSGGGMLRDVLAGEIPYVLRREIYALAAVGGALFYGLAVREWGEAAWLGLTAAGLVTTVRIVAIRLGLNAPTA